LAALVRQRPLEILVVIPTGLDPNLLLNEHQRDWVDRWIEVDRAGFSAANNLGMSLARGRYLATVNDDAVIEDGWLDALLGALANDSKVAAVQGLNLSLDGSAVDGCGIGWNAWWQAIQLGHGRKAGSFQPPTELFGVSATAAIYRRSALDAVTFEHGPFDETLFAYYEDVDLAARLRAAGWTARCVPDARARHAGSVSGRRLPYGGRQLIHGNRHLILARLLGRSFWRHWPRLALRDVLDLLRELSRGDISGALGITAAVGRALRHLPAYAHTGAASVELRPWVIDRPSLDPADRNTL